MTGAQASRGARRVIQNKPDEAPRVTRLAALRRFRRVYSQKLRIATATITGTEKTSGIAKYCASRSTIQL